ncbi:MAG: hypothetical protein B7X00_02020, partial [Legionella sp. 21-45-4]
MLGPNLVYATPVWTITPVEGYSNVVSVPQAGNVLTKYLVTNQSIQPHTLVMSAIHGVQQLTTGVGVCGNPILLSGKQACTLVLQVNGSQVTNSFTDGPQLCQKGGVFQCYNPARSDQLTIVRSSRAEIKLLASPSVITLQAGYSVAQTIRITNTSLLFTAQNIQATLPAGWDVTQNASACTLLAPGMSCDLQLTAGVSTYPATTFSIQGINIQATQVEGSVVSSGAATLSLSHSTLALSVDNPGLNAALSGNPRYITIQNTGSNLANTVTYTPSTNIYFSISPLSGQGCLSSISSGNSCTLTVTPSGATPTPNGAPVILSIAATNSESPVT